MGHAEVNARGPDPGKTPAAGGAAGSSPPGEGNEVPVLTPEEYADLVKKAGERDAYREELLRAKADFANYQKRVIRDRPQFEELAVRRFIIDLLPVLDNYHRALAQEGATIASLKKGIEIVRELMLKALAAHGVAEIDPLGQPFDPLLHEAVGQEETKEFPPDTVCEVLDRGYTQNGTVVRPARVLVARAPVDVTASGAGEAD
jgi:molecular chaperone GrpE